MIKTIFFDTSDTLYHSDEFAQVQSQYPLELLSQRKGMTVEEAKKLFEKTKEELKKEMIHVPKVAVIMKLGITRLDMQKHFLTLEPKNYLQPNKKLNSILEELHNTYKLGIITNILKAFLDNILDALEIDKQHFDHIVSVDNTNNSKPHEEPFLKAIELSGHEPEECVYVGDSLTKDIIPAKKAGMKTIWVTKHPKEDSHVDAHINSILEIKEALEKI